MITIYLSSSIGEKPSIHDDDFHCDVCGRNHKLNDNVRPEDLIFIGASTAEMTYRQAEQQGADLAVKTGKDVEFFKHSTAR